MPRPAVFLDRDGVINERHPPFVLKESQFQILPGVTEAIARLAPTPYAVVVVTNQPAVGHGFMRRSTLEAIHARLLADVRAAGGRIDRIEVCAYGWFRRPPCRKPKPGMLLQAAEALDLDLAASWMIGDNLKDVRAGHSAGCRTILVNPTVRAVAAAAPVWTDVTCPDLPAAIEHVLASHAKASQASSSLPTDRHA